MLRFSGSPSKKGAKKEIKSRKASSHNDPKISLTEWKGWKGILEREDFTPRGLLDPLWCKKRTWRRVKALRIKGRKKWKAKNRLKVGAPTDAPPHNH